MTQVVFIPADKAGILGEIVKLLPTHSLKRKRQAEFRSIERVLKGLKLTPEGVAVFSIGWGVNNLGEAGVLVGVPPSTRAIAQTPEEAEDRRNRGGIA